MNVPRPSQPNAKFRFWSLVVLIMLVTQIILSVGLSVVAILLHRWLGVRYKLGGYEGGLIVPSYLVAFIAAAAIGRRAGFVEPRRTKTLRRIPGPMPATAVETFELRTSESARKQMIIVFLVMGCLIAVIPFLSNSIFTRICAFAASGVFLAFSFYLLWRSKPEDFDLVVRIDKDGITASQGFRRRSAAWQEIEAVEIVVLSGAPSAPATRTYALFGRNSTRLFAFNLLFVPPAEQEKFVHVLRRAFEAQSTVSKSTI